MAAGQRAGIEALVERAAKLLPHQGPIGVFVHQNTMSALEDLPFQAALDLAADALSAQVRLPEEAYRVMLSDGRIAEAELRAELDRDAQAVWREDATAALPCTHEVRWLVLRHGIDVRHWRLRGFLLSERGVDPALQHLPGPTRAAVAEGCRRVLAREGAQALPWRLAGTAEADVALKRVREQLGLGSWEAVTHGVITDEGVAFHVGFAMLREVARRRCAEEEEAPRRADREAFEERVDDLLLPLVSAALDRGAAAELPRLPGGLWAEGARLLRRWIPGGGGAAEAVGRCLDELDPSGARHEALLRSVLLARPGWAGAVRWREHHDGGPALLDYVALRLSVTVSLLRAAGLDPAEVLLYPVRDPLGLGTLADRAAQVLALCGVGPDRVAALDDADWERLGRILDDTGPGWRCRLLQEARERTVRRQWLGALVERARAGRAGPERPQVQVLCCIDEREESFRRALEEAGGASVETFGVAGFFGLALSWRGASDPHPSPRCPAVVAPAFSVQERVGEPPARRRRVLLGWAGHALDRWGLGAVGGLVAALVAGVPALAAVAWRLLAPSASGALLERLLATWAPQPEGEPEVGLDPDTAAAHVAALLQQVGLTGRLAPVVVVVGHGSTSLNNPHESAHNCGACGGHRGDGNARTFAALANDPAVRERLGLGAETVFVAAYHDTASDRVRTWWPAGMEPVAAVEELLARAARGSAAERARRFRAGLDEAALDALARVYRRSVDLAQVRPEYGHATNALLVVGPRALTRGLFFDRRAFLQSYEPDSDRDGAVLTEVLGAAVGVCAGINLEYYWSRVDNERFGAGTKLPHNVTGLHGVMNGSGGDLRTGLPWQMVEVHEPIRLLVVVLAPPARLAAAVENLPAVSRLVEGAWIHLAALDGGEAFEWAEGAFRPARVGWASLPRVEGSAAWWGSRQDALAPCLVSAGTTS